MRGGRRNPRNATVQHLLCLLQQLHTILYSFFGGFVSCYNLGLRMNSPPRCFLVQSGDRPFFMDFSRLSINHHQTEFERIFSASTFRSSVCMSRSFFMASIRCHSADLSADFVNVRAVLFRVYLSIGFVFIRNGMRHLLSQRPGGSFGKYALQNLLSLGLAGLVKMLVLQDFISYRIRVQEKLLHEIKSLAHCILPPSVMEIGVTEVVSAE